MAMVYKTFLFLFALIIATDCELRSWSEQRVNRLKILPSGQVKAVAGSNLVLTCKSEEDITDLPILWTSAEGQPIPNNLRLFSEAYPTSRSVTLFFRNIQQPDAGDYTCSIGSHNATVTVVVHLGIEWVDTPVEQFAVLGKPKEIVCNAESSQSPIISWPGLDRNKRAGVEITSRGLLIHNVTKEHAGVYSCRASVVETGEMEEIIINLQVASSPVWTERPANITVQEGESVSLSCAGHGFPQPTITWLDKARSPVTRIDGSSWHVDGRDRLVCLKIAKSQAGQFTCVVENEGGSLEETVTVNVVNKPSVVSVSRVTTDIHRENVKLICRAAGNPRPKISWEVLRSRNVYSQLVANSRIKIEESSFMQYMQTGETQFEVESAVTFTRINRMDAAKYKCKAESEGGASEQEGSITVEFPPVFVNQTHQVWSWHQKSLNITCKVNSVPPAMLSWWVDNKQIGRHLLDKNFKILGRGPFTQLFIVPVTEQYYQNYTCKAENRLGTSYQTIQVMQAQEPSPVQQIIIENITYSRLDLKIVPPSDSGGIEINYYTAEYKESRQPWSSALRRVWLPHQSNRYKLEYLTPSKTYNVRVGCTNRVGNSPWSSVHTVTVLPIGKPAYPFVYIEVENSTIDRECCVNSAEYRKYTLHSQGGSENVTIKWTEQDDGGSSILFHQVVVHQIDPANSSDSIEVHAQNFSDSDNLEFQFNSSFDYRIKLKAYNKMGWSLPDVIILQFIPDLLPNSKPMVGTSHWIQQNGFYILWTTLAALFLLSVILDFACLFLNRKGVIYTFLTKTKLCRKILVKKKGASGKKNSNHHFYRGGRDSV